MRHLFQIAACRYCCFRNVPGLINISAITYSSPIYTFFDYIVTIIEGRALSLDFDAEGDDFFSIIFISLACARPPLLTTYRHMPCLLPQTMHGRATYSCLYHILDLLSMTTFSLFSLPGHRNTHAFYFSDYFFSELKLLYILEYAFEYFWGCFRAELFFKIYATSLSRPFDEEPEMPMRYYFHDAWFWHAVLSYLKKAWLIILIRDWLRRGHYCLLSLRNRVFIAFVRLLRRQSCSTWCHISLKMNFIDYD